LLSLLTLRVMGLYSDD